MDLTALTLTDALNALERGDWTARQLTDGYLERIEQLNPQLNAFLYVTPVAARQQADSADAERAQGRTRSLLGIPIALKDLYETAGIPTTAGSRILANFIPTKNAQVVARLQAAGCVLLGKLNMHEFAYGTTNENPMRGDAKNPWAPDRITGGSSGGSAAAIAARLCLGAPGSDTGGSIRIPAALCGVTGIKPTYGRVSLRGVIPLSWSNDHAGPLAQTAQDCAHLLNCMAGYDPLDPVSVNVPVPDYTAGLNNSLSGLRVAAPDGYFAAEVQEPILRAREQVVRVIQTLGTRRVSQPLDIASEMFGTNRTILRAEAAAFHAEWLTTRAGDYGADVRARLESAREISTIEYVRAKRHQVELTRTMEEWFQEVDVLVIPTTRISAPRRGTNAVAMAQHLTAFTAPFDVTGFPAISIPAGFTPDGLPIGVQFVARKWEEGLLLNVAHQYQMQTDWHTRVPPLTPSAPHAQ